MKTAAQFTLIFILLLVGCSEPTPEEKQRDLEEEILKKAAPFLNAQIEDGDEILGFENIQIDSTATLTSKLLVLHQYSSYLIGAKAYVEHTTELIETLSGMGDEFIQDKIQSATEVNDSIIRIYEKINNTTDKDDLGIIAYLKMDLQLSDGTIKKGFNFPLLFDKDMNLPSDWNGTNN